MQRFMIVTNPWWRETYTVRHYLAPIVLSFAVILGLTQCSFEAEPVDSFSTTVQGLFSSGFSNDGEHAIVGSMQHGGSLWHTLSRERLFNWNHSQTLNSQITAVAFSPEGDFAATADQATVVLWDVASGRSLRFFNAPSEVLYLALGPLGNNALLALEGGRAVLFDIRNGGIIHELSHDANILSMAMSANGRFALFGVDNKTVQYWDLVSARPLGTIRTAGRANTIAISDDGRMGFTAVQHIDGLVWDLTASTVIARLKYSSRYVATSSSFLTGRFSSDSNLLLTGNTTGAVELWQTSTGDRLERWLTPISYGIGPKVYSIVEVALISDSDQVIAMNSKGTAYRYSF